jgi:hypothetical protein
MINEAEPQEAQLTRQQAQHAMEVAAVKLGNCRLAVKVNEEKFRATVGTFEKAKIAWEQQVDPLSPEQRQERERRSFLHAEQERRRQRGAPHSGANAFVRRNMIRGGQRGAYSMREAARLGFKVPSGS